jgi:glycosyltransferase involved in cell wall biosynthesis
LRDRDVDVHFIVPYGDDSLADAATDAGFEVHRVSLPRIRSPRNVGENLRFLTRFRKTTRDIRSIFESVDPDVIHVNTPYNFQTARAAHLTDAAVVWHFNDTLTPWPVNRIAGWLAPRWADEIVVSADAVREHFFAQGVETTTIYPPVDLEQFDPDVYPGAEAELRTEFGLEDAGPIVGTIGNVNPAKGHGYLLEAVPDVLEQFPDAKFLIVGSKLESQQRYFEELQETINRLGVEDAVRFTGWRSDIPELLSLFDLFVLPSMSEACPVVVLEAMAMRCPVVATDVGGVREQLPDRDCGRVVEPSNPDALATALTQALASPEWQRTAAEHARQRVEEQFSLASCVAEHLSIYEAALEQ